MERPSILQRRLKDLDLFKRLPKNLSKGSLLGVIMTAICLITVTLLLLHETILFFSAEIESGLRVDHRKDDENVEVHLEILFHKFPCPLLGLDVTDMIGTHRMAEHQQLKFETVTSSEGYVETMNMKLSDEEAIQAHEKGMEYGYGCRVSGYFTILLVPGNFHIAFHSRVDAVRTLLSRKGPFDVDFTHTIKHLYFGNAKNHNMINRLKSDFNLRSVTTLNGYSSTQMAPSPGPFSYRYKLLIVPTDLIYEDGTEYDVFQYKTFWNVATQETQFNYIFSVDFELSSLSMTEKRKHKYWSEFIIHISGIIGGLIAFMNFLHSLIQKSVVKVLYKYGLGKYE